VEVASTIGDVLSAAVQVGYIDHEVVINPSRKDLQHSRLNLIVSATEQKKVGEFFRSHSCYVRVASTFATAVTDFFKHLKCILVKAFIRMHLIPFI